MTKQRSGPAKVDRTFRAHSALEWAMGAFVLLGMVGLFLFVRPQSPAALTSANAAQEMPFVRQASSTASACAPARL